MARLIDADALRKRFEVARVDCLGMEPTFTDDEVKDAIDSAPTVGGWISVKDRMPAETHSIFWPWYGRKEWHNAMWREQSDKVLVTVTFKDGTRLVATGETHDGEWSTSIIKTLNPIVTHWMPLPEPPKEEVDTDGNSKR